VTLPIYLPFGRPATTGKPVPLTPKRAVSN
jgi:hypothetical protein